VPKLRALEICGFRSFVTEQRLTFESNLALVWASNSQGKTSIAEAIEFLFTGTTNRRELLGGAKSEFESSLRNAHLAASAPVWVKATIADDAGEEHVACRTLTADYTADKDCVTELTIDGTPAKDLSSLGITLFDPPLRAPVLLQHSLRFALSARPQDRTDYFKGLLEVQDLDLLVDVIDTEVADLTPISTELTQKLRDLENSGRVPTLRAELNATSLSDAEVDAILGAALSSALVDLGEEDGASKSVAERAEALREALEARRQNTFPVAEYNVGPQPSPISQPTFEKLIAYRALAEVVETEAESMRNVFEAVLAIPIVSHTTSHIDCPVCETPDALTPARIEVMRQQIAEAKDLRQAQQAAKGELDSCLGSLNVLDAATGKLRPAYTGLGGAELLEREAAVTQLIGSAAAHQKAAETATDLNGAHEKVEQASTALRDAVNNAKTSVTQAKTVDAEALLERVIVLNDAVTEAAGPRTNCAAAVDVLLLQIKEAIDKRQGLEHWRGLIELTGEAAQLAKALREARARATVKGQLEQARKEIAAAKLKVFQDKFSEMSVEITRWWELLRPDEPVHFEAIRPRASGKRFVDFKAHLRPQLGVKGVERDALGIFSDSQLNALGVAAFLARATLQKSPLIVLDDPLQAGDGDHRSTFVRHVIQELLDDGIQIIVLTFDDMTKKTMHNLYESLPIDGFLTTLEHPKNGSIVAKTSDTADALLQQAAIYLHSDNEAQRRAGSNALRLAAERLAKEILVKQRTAKGESCSLADYEGETLGPLITALSPYLTEQAERGKWKAVNTWLSPGSHDAPVPSRADLRTAHGDLRAFYKTYIKT
jgi:hypothetical protein